MAANSSREDEPDLFFPISSDSEDESTAVPASTVTAGRSEVPSSATLVPSNPGRLNGEGSADANGGGQHLFSSQDSDVIPLGEPSTSTSRPRSPSLQKNRLSQTRPSLSRKPSVIPTDFAGYLGEFVCEGWSLSKGKGYCVPGSKIVFERPKPKKVQEADAPRSGDKMGPARLVGGKIVNGKSKAAAGKQMTLGSMGLAKKAALVSNEVMRAMSVSLMSH